MSSLLVLHQIIIRKFHYIKHSYFEFLVPALAEYGTLAVSSILFGMTIFLSFFGWIYVVVWRAWKSMSHELSDQLPRLMPTPTPQQVFATDELPLDPAPHQVPTDGIEEDVEVMALLGLFCPRCNHFIGPYRANVPAQIQRAEIQCEHCSAYIHPEVKFYQVSGIH